MDRRRRRDLIRELIRTRSPSTQMELVRLLSERGVRVDQSTVSRDLREMGIVRLTGGGYALPDGEGVRRVKEELERALRTYALSLEPSGNLVVIRTPPGNAHALAVILDRAGLEEVAGTVAGDDTILVVVRQGFQAASLVGEWMEKAGLL
ncbi:MAG: arginine repressor [Actinomycetota bacterium]